MGRKDLSDDLMEKAEVGTLGHLLCVTSSWEKQLGREPALEGCFYSGVSRRGLSC